MWFLSSCQGTSPIFLHPLVQDHYGHPSNHFLLTCRTWPLIPLLSGAPVLQQLGCCLYPAWGCPLCTALCVEMLRAAECQGLGCLPETACRVCCPHRQQWQTGGVWASWCEAAAVTDKLPGPQEGSVPDGSTASKLFATSLRMHCSLLVCRVAVVELVSKERKECFLKTFVVAER